MLFCNKEFGRYIGEQEQTFGIGAVKYPLFFYTLDKHPSADYNQIIVRIRMFNFCSRIERLVKENQEDMLWIKIQKVHW